MTKRSQSRQGRSSHNQLDLFAPGARPPAAPLKTAPPARTKPQPAVRELLAQGAAAPASPRAALPRADLDQAGRAGLLDVRAAAAFVGLSKSTLDKMRCFGTGPRYIKLTTAAVRYDPADLSDWIAARRDIPG